MRRIENECVCCDLPCIDCGRKAVERVYCDVCDEELDFWEGGIEYEGDELCPACAKQKLIDCFFDTVEKKRAFYREWVKDDELPEDLDVLTNDELLEIMNDEEFDLLATAADVDYSTLD